MWMNATAVFPSAIQMPHVRTQHPGTAANVTMVTLETEWSVRGKVSKQKLESCLITRNMIV